MTFTDDDLKRLKNDLKENGDFRCQECGLNQENDFDALLARLEAAEKVCGEGHSQWCEISDKPCECGYEVWRKAAGK